MIYEMNYDSIDLTYPAPEDEPARQNYYIAAARKIVSVRSRQKGRDLTACVKTFGCQMNERDSEKLRGILQEIGFVIIPEEEADLVLYNTCTVRENANLKVYGRLGYLKGLKEKNPDMIIGLCGCMMQEHQVVEKLERSYRFIDLIFGTHNIYKLAELLNTVLANPGRMMVDLKETTDTIVEKLPADRTYFFKSGVNIMYGCNNFCTYCIVPYVRGREISRRPVEIIREIEKLADDGVVEIMLLGQNVNSYGKNLDETITFAQLLREVEKIDGIERIRFMTSHPKDLSDELIEVMSTSKKICPHMHLPLQSGSTSLLNKMNRHYTKDRYLTLVEKLRAAVPDISITTDIIVGFPGETEEDFQETLDVVRRTQFDSAFTFIYSRRTGTPAASMPDQIREDVIKDRFDRLLELVQKTGSKRSARFEGRVMPVLVEHKNEQEKHLVTGRIPQDLVVHFPGDESLIGKIVKVKLKECKGFYYLGERV